MRKRTYEPPRIERTEHVGDMRINKFRSDVDRIKRRIEFLQARAKRDGQRGTSYDQAEIGTLQRALACMHMFSHILDTAEEDPILALDAAALLLGQAAEGRHDPALCATLAERCRRIGERLGELAS